MNYNSNARKIYSKKIITTNDELDQQHSAYLERLNRASTDLTEESSKDYLNRKTLSDSLHGYIDTFEEIRYLNHYKINPNYASYFLKMGNIKISEYIRDFLKETQEVTFEDCLQLWKPFYKYSPARSSNNIVKTRFFDDDSAFAESNQKAIPIVPTKKEFQELIIRTSEKPNVVAKDITSASENTKNILYNQNSIKNTDYSYIENISQFDITPSGEKVSYSNFNGGTSFNHKIYTIENNDSSKTESYAEKIVNDKFSVGKVHFFYNNKSFGFGKVIESHVRTDRISLKPEYQNDSSASSGDEEFDESVYESEDSYWDCEYYAVVSFEFDLINGDSKLSLLGNITDEIVENVVNILASNLKSILAKASENSKKTIDIVKVEGNEKYDELIDSLSKEATDLKSAISLNNTIVAEIKNWISDRESKLLEVIKDETLADSCIGMIKERENKLTGSLFGWYTQTCVPLSDEYERYLEKINNNIFIFNTMLVAPLVILNYTDEKNGGAEISNPNFIDVAKENYSYYKKVNKSDFQVGETVYLIDDNNPEIPVKITEIKNWTGTKDGKDIELKRIMLDKTIPDIYNNSTLRIVRS